MRSLAVVLASAGVLVTSAAGSAGTAQTTSLTVTYWATGPGADPVRWTLRCNPARGTLPRPGLACRKLAEGGLRLFAPVPRNVACTQIYGGPQTARVTGLLAGKRVWAAFSRSDGCQIARWNRLAPWLLPRGGVAS